MARALIFDFDGTIVDTETTLFQAYAEAFEQHGHRLDRARWLEVLGTDNEWDPLVDLEALVGALDPVVRTRRRARRDELIHAAGVRAGVVAWLDDAERLGMPVGIASSSSLAWVEQHLERVELRARFVCLSCAGDGVPGKPDPTSYRLACERLGADPAQSIAVEDSPNGVAAAKAAGLFVVATPHALTETLDLSNADIVVGSLAQLSLEELVSPRRASPAG